MAKYLTLCFVIGIVFASGLTAQKKILLEDIYERNIFQTKSVSDFRFLNDGVHYTRKENGVIKKFNILTLNTTGNIFDASTFKNRMEINGMCDWVYEEEFSFTRAFEWYENGSFQAYIRFDESEVL